MPSMFLMGLKVASAQDFDGDGWTTSAGDCDDANPALHPEAQEACDGLDNDCSGLADDAPAAIELYYGRYQAQLCPFERAPDLLEVEEGASFHFGVEIVGCATSIDWSRSGLSCNGLDTYAACYPSVITDCFATDVGTETVSVAVSFPQASLSSEMRVRIVNEPVVAEWPASDRDLFLGEDDARKIPGIRVTEGSWDLSSATLDGAPPSIRIDDPEYPGGEVLFSFVGDELTRADLGEWQIAVTVTEEDGTSDSIENAITVRRIGGGGGCDTGALDVAVARYLALLVLTLAWRRRGDRLG